MAKQDKEKRSGGGDPKAPSPSKATVSDPRLAKALATFKRGDYVHAKVQLTPLVFDQSLSEGERKQATLLLAATRLDSAVPKTALASLGLLLLVLVLTSVFQP